MLSGYITTLKTSRNSTFRTKALRQELVAEIGEKCTGFYTKSMKASRDKKIYQLDGFNHNKV